jgi:hypothetical protein
MSFPTVITIGGSTVGQVASGIIPGQLRPWAKDGAGSFSFYFRGLTLQSGRPDPYTGEYCVVSINGTNYFKGRVQGPHYHFDARLGWVKEYQCVGLKAECDYVSVTDDVTLTDTVEFNQITSDPNFIASRAGRTVGQMIAGVLSGTKVSADLQSFGLGNYSSGGSGATATASVSSGGVSSVTVTAAGSGYTTAPAVIFVGGGGSGAVAHTTLSGTGVVTVVVTSAGGGYTSPPAVIISTLPAITINDLAALMVIPAHPVDFVGEKLGSAIAGELKAYHPNHFFHVEPDGTFRFLDLRKLGDVTVTITDATGAGGQIAAVVFSGVIVKLVVVNGGKNMTGGSLSISSSGSGSGATGTYTTSRGVITSASITAGGSGYFGSAVTLNLGDQRVGNPQLHEDITECYGRVVIRGEAYAEPAYLTLANGGLAEGFAHDGLTSAQAKNAWKAGDFLQPAVPAGVAAATATISGSTINTITVSNTGYGYSSAPTVHYFGGGGTITGLTAHLTGNQVSSITWSSSSGFSSAPTITIDPPGVDSGQTVSGTCTMSSTTTVSITSADSTTVFASDAWDQTSTGRHGTMYLFDSTASGSINQTFAALVAANTSMSAGGTSVITLAQAAPTTTFNSFLLAGTVVGGPSIVWRRYSITNAALAHQQLNAFAWPQAYANCNGDAAVLTMAPQVYVDWSASGMTPYEEVPVGFTFDPVAGTILLNQPAVFNFGTTANLAIGGSSTDGIPTDVRYFAAINKGSLTAIEPPNSGSTPTYTGTFDSETGVHRTLYVQVRGWRDPSNNASMLTFAQEMLDSVKNIVIEGSVQYMTLCEAFLVPGSTVTFGNANYNNPWSGTTIPLVEPELAWAAAPQALAYSMDLRVSTRRAHYTAAPFLHPSQTGAVLGFGLGSGEGYFSAYSGLGVGATYRDTAADVQLAPLAGQPAALDRNAADGSAFADAFLGSPFALPSSHRRRRERRRQERRRTREMQEFAQTGEQLNVENNTPISLGGDEEA